MCGVPDNASRCPKPSDPRPSTVPMPRSKSTTRAASNRGNWRISWSSRAIHSPCPSKDGSTSRLSGLCWEGGGCTNRKDFFRQQGVHDAVAVHELRDVDVHRDARQHVGVIAAQMLFCHEEVDHVAHGMLRGF